MRNEFFQEGIEQGVKRGWKENMRDVALRMLQAEKYSLDEIVAISGLSLCEVKKLASSKTI